MIMKGDEFFESKGADFSPTQEGEQHLPATRFTLSHTVSHVNTKSPLAWRGRYLTILAISWLGCYSSRMG